MTWNPLEKAKTSKTFCVIPWIQQYVGTRGNVKPCCVYKHQMDVGNLSDNSLKEIWNNDATKAMRLKFLNGELDTEGCEKCNRNQTTQSARIGYNATYFSEKYAQDAVKSTLPDGSVPEHKLYYMDVRFNNLCNLSCRTCSPHFSSNWIEDYKKLHTVINFDDAKFQFPGTSEDHAFNEMLPHLQTMKHIYFAGGEPLIQIQHYKTLQKLIELGNTSCTIVYNTNLTKLKLQEHNVIDYWKKFKNVIVHASIDGSHERAEYWRHGTKWKDIVDNATHIKTHAPNVRFAISYTLAWPNALNLIDLHKEWFAMGLIEIENVNINLLYGPYYYALAGLPDWKKKHIETCYREYSEWIKANASGRNVGWLLSQIEDSINFMNTDKSHDVSTSMYDFNQVNTKLDKIRNEDFFKVFPEHLDMKQWLSENAS